VGMADAMTEDRGIDVRRAFIVAFVINLVRN
jgi:hypothetical protein